MRSLAASGVQRVPMGVSVGGWQEGGDWSGGHCGLGGRGRDCRELRAMGGACGDCDPDCVT